MDSPAAQLVGDDDGVVVVDSTLAPWFEFDSPASGSVVHICYKFNGEKLVEADMHTKTPTCSCRCVGN